MVGRCAINALVKLKDNGSIPLFRELLENDKYWHFENPTLFTQNLSLDDNKKHN